MSVPSQGPALQEYSLDEIDAKLQKLQQQLEQKAVEICSRQMHKILQDKMESDTLLEGRAALFTVEIEKKMLAKLQQFKN